MTSTAIGMLGLRSFLRSILGRPTECLARFTVFFIDVSLPQILARNSKLRDQLTAIFGDLMPDEVDGSGIPNGFHVMPDNTIMSDNAHIYGDGYYVV